MSKSVIILLATNCTIIFMFSGVLEITRLIIKVDILKVLTNRKKFMVSVNQLQFVIPRKIRYHKSSFICLSRRTL